MEQTMTHEKQAENWKQAWHMRRHMVVDVGELGDMLPHMNITNYFEDCCGEMVGARLALSTDEMVKLEPWPKYYPNCAQDPKSLRETIDYLGKMTDIVDGKGDYYLVDSSGTMDNEELKVFAEKQGIDDIPFKIGEAPEYYTLPYYALLKEQLNSYYQGGIKVRASQNRGGLGCETDSPRRRPPEVQKFEKGHTAWYAKDGEAVLNWMKEQQEDGQVVMKNGDVVEPDKCYPTKKICLNRLNDLTSRESGDDLGAAVGQLSENSQNLSIQ